MTQKNTNNNKSSAVNTSQGNDTVTDKKGSLPTIPTVNVIQDLETSGLHAEDGGSEGENGAGENAKEGKEGEGAEEEASMYKRFSPATYEFLVQREEEEKRKELEKKNNVEEGRLVDGQLKFGDDDEEQQEEKKDKDPLLVEGNNLPEDLPPFPKKYYGLPMEEIDPYIKDKVGIENGIIIIII